MVHAAMQSKFITAIQFFAKSASQVILSQLNAPSERPPLTRY